MKSFRQLHSVRKECEILRLNMQASGDLGHGKLAGFIGWTFSGGLVAKTAVVVTTVVAARSLNPHQFGEYVGLTAAALLASGLWDLGVSALLIIECASGRVPAGCGIRQVLRLRSRTAALWLAVLAVGVMVIDRQRDIPVPAIVAFAGVSLCGTSSMVALAMLRARFLFRRAAFSGSMGRWLTAIISLAALPMIGLAHGLNLFALATLAGEALVLISAVVALTMAGTAPGTASPMTDAEVRRVLTLTRSLPYAANGLLALVYNRIDVLIVGGLASVGQLSLYAPASRIQDALYLIPSSLEAVAYPVMSRVFNSPEGVEGVARLVRRFALGGLALSIPVTCVCYFYTPQLLSYLLGSEYLGATTATRVLVWFLPIACVCAPMIVALAACGRAVDTTKVFAIAAIVAISMHLALDWRFGATGGAIASLSRDPFALLAAFFLARRAGVSLAVAKAAPTRRIIESGAVS